MGQLNLWYHLQCPKTQALTLSLNQLTIYFLSSVVSLRCSLKAPWASRVLEEIIISSLGVSWSSGKYCIQSYLVSDLWPAYSIDTNLLPHLLKFLPYQVFFPDSSIRIIFSRTRCRDTAYAMTGMWGRKSKQPLTLGLLVFCIPYGNEGIYIRTWGLRIFQCFHVPFFLTSTRLPFIMTKTSTISWFILDFNLLTYWGCIMCKIAF